LHPPVSYIGANYSTKNNTMKFLKVLLIILLVIAGLLLVIPVFLPGKATISATADIALSPEQIFYQTARYTDRTAWDPWLKMEPDAEVTIRPQPGYVGSTYTWKGDKIGNGKMQVDSVRYPGYIASSIWFGESPDPALVEWILDEKEGGTHVTWQFTSEGSYPFGRLMLLMMKGPLQNSFTSGLADYKALLEANPPRMYELSAIGIEKSYPTHAMVIPASGTMQEIAELMQVKFPLLGETIGRQGLEMNGPAFAHYLNYDAETGLSDVLLAMPVKEAGASAGEVRPRYYDTIEAVAATHTGKFEYLMSSYETLSEYVAANNLEVTGEAFEVYLTSPLESPDPMTWKTMIAFPLKK
jgi:hypothetical protein